MIAASSIYLYSSEFATSQFPHWYQALGMYKVALTTGMAVAFVIGGDVVGETTIQS